MNILIRMPNWIGDAVMATPILQDVRAHFPDARITAMCRRPTCELLEKEEAIDELFCFSPSEGSFSRRDEHKSVIEAMRKGQFDLGILLTHSFSSAWWMWQGHVKRRIGFAAHWRSFLLTDRLALPLKGSEHQVNTYKRLLQPLGIQRSDTAPRLIVSDEEMSAARALLTQRGYKADKPLIGINPGAAYGSAKCWPIDRFFALMQELLKEKELQIVLFGDAQTEKLVKQLYSDLPPRVMQLAGATTLRELMCLIRCCNVLVTNDSGPMHIAAAFGVPLVALFGSTDENATGPYGQSESVLREKVSCSPCFKRKCPIDFRCMKKIEVDQVLRAVQKERQRNV